MTYTGALAGEQKRCMLVVEVHYYVILYYSILYYIVFPLKKTSVLTSHLFFIDLFSVVNLINHNELVL